MKTEKNIFVAFFLNISFSIIELFGGLFTNSIAILSDAIHDFVDALSIGISYFLEKKSKKKPDNKYTYGYIRYSILGALITTVILITGSIFVIINALIRLFNPVTINYDGMLILSVFGIIFNLLATYMTKEGDSLNQKSVNLHMLEDAFGWIVVLIGSLLIKLFDIIYIDSLMSIFIAIYILFHALHNLSKVIDLFLIKVPKNINIDKIKNKLEEITDIIEIHHIHVWSIDGYNNYATLHVVSNQNEEKLKKIIKKELSKFNISHSTIEFEKEDEKCLEKNCRL